MTSSTNDKTNDKTNDTIDRFRQQFILPQPGPDSPIHLNNAGQTLLCRPARATVEHWMRIFAEEAASGYPQLVQAMTVARSGLAAFFGCEPTELAFFQSAAGAISQVALGLDLKPGDEIIVWDQEYPSNLYPWNEAARRSGARLLLAHSGADLSTPIDAIEKLLSPRTRVIATSWVQFRTGAITDLGALTALARPRGIFTCADIIQGVGLLPFDFHASGLDAACGGSHKWMNSAHGAGYLLLRQEHLERLTPLMFGTMTFTASDTTPDLTARPRTDAARFEPGGKAFAEILALSAAADLLKETGVARIAQEAEWLARKLMHGLRERGYVINSPHGQHFRGSIVNFKPGPDAPLKTLAEIERRLNEKRVSFGLRAPGVRLAPHAYNTEAEIERVLRYLE